MDAQKIAGPGKNARFVHHHPVFYPVAEVFGAYFNIGGKPIHRFAVCPPAFQFQFMWQVPVIKGNPGLNAFLQAIVDHLVVMIYSRLVYCARTHGQYARPRYGKPEIRDIELFNQVDILLVLVVKIAGHAGVVAAFYLARATYKYIPDRGSFAMRIASPFHLESGGRNAPGKIVTKKSLVYSYRYVLVSGFHQIWANRGPNCILQLIKPNVYG